MIELLAPAGSLESLTAAVNAGADAVYIGGSRFGARAYADNPENDALLEGIDYCHLHGVKLYQTVNTLLKEQELREDLVRFLTPAYERGLDGVIVQDLGVMKVLRDAFPALQLHASTQLTVTGPGGANLLKRFGVCRVVPARELSLDEIRSLIRETGMEVETFVHGAMCYSYSGQCLFSSMAGGRSGNRGRCAQPCRLPYELLEDGKRIHAAGSHLMSLKDMCAIRSLPALMEAGIASLKIEGRMKRPEYTAGVVSVYRKYIDRIAEDPERGGIVSEEDMTALRDLYSRGGFSGGYYFARKGPEMMCMSRPNHMGSQAAVVVSGKGSREYKRDNGNVMGRALLPLYPQDVLEAVPAQRPEERMPYESRRQSELKDEKRRRGGRKFENRRRDDAGTDGQRKDRQAEYQLGNAVAKGAYFRLPAQFSHMVEGTELYRTRCESLLEQIRKTWLEAPKKEKINGELILFKGKPAILNVSFSGIQASAEGPVPEPAQNRPVTEEEIRRQLCRTGATPFVFEDLKIFMGEDLFLPMQSVNALRREALDALQREILQERLQERNVNGARLRREFLSQADTTKPEPHAGGRADDTGEEQRSAPVFEGVWISLYSEAQLKAVAEQAGTGVKPHAVCAPWYFWEKQAESGPAETLQKAGTLLYTELPDIMRADTVRLLREDPARQALGRADGFVVRTLDALAFLRSEGFDRPVIASPGFYAYNTAAVSALSELGIGARVLPLELTAQEMRPLTGEEHPFGTRKNSESILTIYGRTPLMFTAQCLRDNTAGCLRQTGWLSLRDRKGMEFPVLRVCRNCSNIIYNCVPLNLFSCGQEIRRLGTGSVLLSFTTESGRETGQVLEALRFFLDEKEEEETFREFARTGTRGHFRKGVE